MDYVNENSAKPASVYSLGKANGFDEQEFYEHFGSMDALESQIFVEFFNNTMELLHKSKDYADYDARHKLLSFYFTYFELLTANRSYVCYALMQYKNQLKNLKVLKAFKTSFGDFINSLDLSLIQLEQDRIQQIQKKGLEESAWIQFLLTLRFWIDDSSARFEKTDIFIEKSVNTTFDVMDAAPLKSLLDLGKFIYKEKIKMP